MSVKFFSNVDQLTLEKWSKMMMEAAGFGEPSGDSDAAKRVPQQLWDEATNAGNAMLSRNQFDVLYPFLDRNWRDFLKWHTKTQQVIVMSTQVVNSLHMHIEATIVERVAKKLER